MSFLALHIHKHKAETPTRVKTLDCLSNLFNQLPNILVILARGGRSKVKVTERQSSLTKGQLMNRYSIVFCSPQKIHFVHLFHLLLTKGPWRHIHPTISLKLGAYPYQHTWETTWSFNSSYYSPHALIRPPETASSS
jgi:hypothetical protein